MCILGQLGCMMLRHLSCGQAAESGPGADCPHLQLGTPLLLGLQQGVHLVLGVEPRLGIELLQSHAHHDVMTVTVTVTVMCM